VLAGSRWHAPSSRASYGMARSASRCRTATAERGLCDPYQQPTRCGDHPAARPDRLPGRHRSVEVGCVVDRVAGGLDEFAGPDDRPLAGPARAPTGRGRRVPAIERLAAAPADAGLVIP